MERRATALVAEKQPRLDLFGTNVILGILVIDQTTSTILKSGQYQRYIDTSFYLDGQLRASCNEEAGWLPW
jgi:hypothetical protein